MLGTERARQPSPPRARRDLPKRLVVGHRSAFSRPEVDQLPSVAALPRGAVHRRSFENRSEPIFRYGPLKPRKNHRRAPFGRVRAIRCIRPEWIGKRIGKSRRPPGSPKVEGFTDRASTVTGTRCRRPLSPTSIRTPRIGRSLVRSRSRDRAGRRRSHSRSAPRDHRRSWSPPPAT